MDITFVKNTEDDVNHEDRNNEQKREVSYRILKLSRSALERSADGCRQSPRDLADLVDCLAERNSRPQIERYRHGRQLAEVMDRQRTRVLCHFGKSIERHQLPFVRLDVYQR